MKNKLLTTLIMAGSLAVPVAASAEGMVGTNVLGLASGAIGAYYQGSLDDSGAYLAGASILPGGGFGVNGGYKKYFDSYADGAYWGVMGGYGSYTFAGWSITTISVLGVAGYEMPFSDKFVGGVYGGAGYVSVNTNQIGFSTSGIGIGFGATIAYKL